MRFVDEVAGVGGLLEKKEVCDSEVCMEPESEA